MSHSLTKWIDQDVLRRLYEPTIEIGVIFVIESLVHLIFLICLTLFLQALTSAENTLAVRTAILPLISPATAVVSTQDIVAFLSTFVSSNFGSVAHASVFGFVEQQLLVVGAVQFLQHRSFSSQCAASNRCFSGPSESPDAFGGVLSGEKIQVLSQTCVNPLVCTAGTVSDRSGRVYPYGGLVLPYFNRTFFCSKIFSLSDSADVMSSFVDASTRFVSMSFVVVSADTSIASQISVNFELPQSGGVYWWSSVRSMSTNELGQGSVFACVFWAYGLISITIELTRFVLTLRRQTRCIACRYGSSNEKKTFGSSCASCGKAIVIDATETTSCGFCSVSIPPIRHTCFRSQFHVSKLVVLANVALVILGYQLSRAAVNSARTELAHALGSTAPVLMSLSSSIDLYDLAVSISGVSLILTFVGIYRFLGRVPWSAQFLRVFSSAGVLTVFFFVGYSAVFVGFALCFHLLLAEIAGSFTTFRNAFSGLFAIILGYVDWPGITAEASGVFFATFMIFCWLCILVMANILISLLTVEYKRATKVKVYDLEAASLMLLLSKCTECFKLAKRSESDGAAPSIESKETALLSDDRGSDVISLPEQESHSAPALEELVAALQSLSNSLEKVKRGQHKKLSSIEKNVNSLSSFTAVCGDL